MFIRILMSPKKGTARASDSVSRGRTGPWCLRGTVCRAGQGTYMTEKNVVFHEFSHQLDQEDGEGGRCADTRKSFVLQIMGKGAR